MNKVKAVIFDLDGLLIDSESMWQKTDKKLLKRRGIIYQGIVRNKIRGLGQKEVMELFKREFGVAQDTDALINERRDIFYSLAKKGLKLLPGVIEIIKEFHKRGYLLAIATGGHRKEKIKEILSKFGLSNYFSVLVSSDEVKNGKPAPDVYLLTATLLGAQPLNCLVLEDAVNGVLAAKAAGMKVFGVNKDLQIRTKLKEAGADKIFTDLKEVANILV